ncbi:MAG: hypothetical protein Q4E02_03870 [Lagierella massiliensis]|nr:hypothetical protein [Lagierella massiliensis]
MIDIHSHVLPYLDDGAQSIEESLEIVQIYKENGFTGVIATPHHYYGKYLPSKEEIIESHKLLTTELKKNDDKFNIYLGNENFLDENTIPDLKSKNIFTMGGSRYVLVEIPLNNKNNFAKEIIFNIQMLGYLPILAHVERYKITKDDFNFIEELYKAGVLIQINLSSLKNEGSSYFEMTNKLLERKMVQFVGTDTHSKETRNPDVSEQLYYLKDKMGDDWYNEVVIQNPYKMLKNQLIKKEVIEIENKRSRKSSFLSKLFKRD